MSLGSGTRAVKTTVDRANELNNTRAHYTSDACVAVSALNPHHHNSTHVLAANMADKSDSQDKDIDELDDDFGSEDEDADPNVFRIANSLTPPSAMSYSAKELHSEPTPRCPRWAYL